MSGGIERIVMPKWGLAMQEGMLAAWSVKEGDTIAKGQEICDIETSKIANVFESPVSGKLRRLVTGEGETVPVGFLLAVVADDSVSDADINTYIDDFKANFVVEDAGDGGPATSIVETDAGRIRYLAAGDGDGTPLIFVHGFGGDYMNWMLIQSDLSDGRKSYAIDLPGHGGSTKDVGHGNIGSLTSAVFAFMQAMNIDKAHFVGHSLGGGVCLDMARNHPEKIESATLIAPAGLGPEINMDYIDGFIREKRSRKLRPYLEMLVNDPSLISGEMVEEVIRFKRLDGAEAALNTVAGACFQGGHQTLEMTERVQRMTPSLQVIWGRNDRILPVSHSEGLPDTIPVTRFDDTGHLPQMERAAEVIETIKSFIS
ncbi:MAG: acetoin dehydrogenase dihydrolipoyllysine-residue acetyltransferase subunit [Geminicoccaceae bacterium]|nr:acetoin dehydrogenase dihydrolipoyllysine-residue acetyltransferase subunit [Geminicoccaceae bacterium]